MSRLYAIYWIGTDGRPCRCAGFFDTIIDLAKYLEEQKIYYKVKDDEGHYLEPPASCIFWLPPHAILSRWERPTVKLPTG
jgi:hypothetical protein